MPPVRGGRAPSKGSKKALAGNALNWVGRWYWEDDGENWTPYSDEQNELICNAFRTSKKTVSIKLASGIAFKVIFDNMVQQNSQSAFKRRIRLALEDGDFYVWEWEADGPTWVVYDAHSCVELEGAHRAKSATLDLSTGGHVYRVDLNALTQTNVVTGTVRAVRRQPVGKTDTDANSGGSQGAEGIEVKQEAKPQEAKPKEEEKQLGLPSSTEGGGAPVGGARAMRSGVKRGRQPSQPPLESVGLGNGDEESDAPPSRKPRSGRKSVKSEPKAAPETSEGQNDTTGSSEVVKTIVMNGRAPVDPECKAKLGKAHVYSEGNNVYDVMLNQTNVGLNNNKFYLIQLLRDNDMKSFSVWMRWGRVGRVGMNSLKNCSNLLDARELFEDKFLQKTKNEWSQRSSFQKVPGKYDIVPIDYSTDAMQTTETDGAQKPPPLQKQSLLDLRVQNLLELICNVRAMEETILEMKFDAKKAPLGKVTKAQIKAGYESLKKVESCLKRNVFGREMVDACSEFYTRIPHDFGMKTPPLIRTEKELKEKIQLLEVLSDIEIAIKFIRSAEQTEHRLDQCYQELHCKMTPLERDHADFKMIERYMTSTHASTHNEYSLSILDAFVVEKEGEAEKFLADYGNRMLLWHGSRLSNWAGILSQGLKIAPPEAPVTGYMFGKGIYFADMCSKSANYCYTTQKKNVGLVLLSEVALGKCAELLAANDQADKLPKGKHSTKGLGKVAPDPSNSVKIDGGEVTVPMGPSTETNVTNTSGFTLNYNEYVVYRPEQVRMRYLLKVSFDYKPMW